jgi:7-cyano-7-deazaguanine reductase
MNNDNQEYAELSVLGTNTKGYTFDKPDSGILEAFPNKHPENNYTVKLQCFEFTSLCPITGQPDFATIDIEYIPAKKIVESKSLKLYLFSFRNHGEFHEDCINRITNDLWELLEPKWIKVTGNFNSRGGIAIIPIVEKGTK